MNTKKDNDNIEIKMCIKRIREQYSLIAGVDEVGRGPLIGDVVTAAVILDPNNPIKGLNDSKKISEKKRNSLFEEIKEKALCYSIARATSVEIDQINILQATLLAMQRAINTLKIPANFVLVDGNKCPTLDIPSLAVIKGDYLIPEISAASILAKVTRDREMIALDALHPEYGFAKHKGYPTAIHLQAIKDHGILVTHRKSFAPIAKISKLINTNL